MELGAELHAHNSRLHSICNCNMLAECVVLQRLSYTAEEDHDSVRWAASLPSTVLPAATKQLLWVLLAKSKICCVQLRCSWSWIAKAFGTIEHMVTFAGMVSSLKAPPLQHENYLFLPPVCSKLAVTPKESGFKQRAAAAARSSSGWCTRLIMNLILMCSLIACCGFSLRFGLGLCRSSCLCSSSTAA